MKSDELQAKIEDLQTQLNIQLRKESDDKYPILPFEDVDWVLIYQELKNWTIQTELEINYKKLNRHTEIYDYDELKTFWMFMAQQICPNIYEPKNN